MSNILPEKLFDYLNSAILCIDSKHKICQINSTTEELFEISQGNLIGASLNSIILNAKETFIRSLNYVIRTNQPITEREAQFGLTNGHHLIVDYSIKPINELDNETRYFIEITPISRHIQIAQDEYAHTQTQAAAQLTRGMAHEIKNPLGGIRGAAQLLASELNQPSLKEYTDVIIKETDRLTELLNNMLGPNKALEKQNVNILEILEHIRQIIMASCQKQITFKRDYDPSIPEFSADKNQLIQAFMNLARNAVQAIERRGIVTFKTRILNQHTIGIHKYPTVLIVSISDNGSGIDKEVANNLFLPMVTSKQNGSGLGLPISQKIIMDHGGIIQCHPTNDTTTFNTLIPLII